MRLGMTTAGADLARQALDARLAIEFDVGAN